MSSTNTRNCGTAFTSVCQLTCFLCNKKIAAKLRNEQWRTHELWQLANECAEYNSPGLVLGRTECICIVLYASHGVCTQSCFFSAFSKVYIWFSRFHLFAYQMKYTRQDNPYYIFHLQKDVCWPSSKRICRARDVKINRPHKLCLGHTHSHTLARIRSRTNGYIRFLGMHVPRPSCWPQPSGKFKDKC